MDEWKLTLGWEFSKSEKIYLGLVLSTSLIIFVHYVILNSIISYYDENGYIAISKSILKNGLFGIDEPLFQFRTYLYPLLISVFTILGGNNMIIAKIMMSVFQYVVYLFTVVILANRLTSINNKLLWFSIVTIGFCNPYFISISTNFLTDTLGICFSVISIVGLLTYRLEKTSVIAAIISLFFVSVMIRPSSLIFLPILVGILILRYFKYHDVKILKFILLSILLASIFIPQLYNNVVQFHHWTIMTHFDVYRDNTLFGVYVLKYGTVIIPGQNPQLAWLNPWPHIEGQSIWNVLISNPYQFLFTYFSHIYGTLDWGYLEPYIKDLYSANRLIGSWYLYSVWYLALIGIMQYKNSDFFEKNKTVLKIMLASAGIYTLFIGTAHAEGRYGYQIFLFLLPTAGYGICWVYKFITENVKSSIKQPRLFFISITYILFLVLCFYSSFLFDQLTGRIDWFTHLKSLFP